MQMLDLTLCLQPEEIEHACLWQSVRQLPACPSQKREQPSRTACLGVHRLQTLVTAVLHTWKSG